MLVLTRRPGESILIGESIEVRIVDVDAHDLDARFAISAIDVHGDELHLCCVTRPDGTALVSVPVPEKRA